MTDSDSQFLHHGPCPKCGSSDGLAVYDDGHEHCFAFGCGHRTRAGGDRPPPPRQRVSGGLLTDQSAIEKTIRGITPETFKHWGYREGTSKGQRVHLANHYRDGRLIGQKVRKPGKKFAVTGELSPLYGSWLWAGGGKMLIVTEGELDALSVSQAQGNKWPVVSVAKGAAGAAKCIREEITWVESFDKVVFFFDADEPGRESALECARELEPGKAFIATAPAGYKDANDLLKDGKTEDLMRCIWQAREFRPDGILSLKDVIADILRPIEVGYEWAFEVLTKLTHGRRLGETYYLGAGTGVGKTDFLTECITHDLMALGENVGVVFLEQSPQETGKRLAGKVASRRFHIPDAGWTVDELEAAVTTLEGAQGNLYMYDNFGSTEWDAVKERITYMAQAGGCRFIYLDHLTALAAAEEDERKALEHITAEIAMLAKRLRICIMVVSHLATPDKGSHEEGARVMIRHFKGSRAIGFWAHYMFALERDQQAEDEEKRKLTTFRVLKDRYTGQATGEVFYMTYDFDTGRLSVVDGPHFDGFEPHEPDVSAPPDF